MDPLLKQHYVQLKNQLPANGWTEQNDPNGYGWKVAPKKSWSEFRPDVPRSTNVTLENARVFFESGFTWVVSFHVGLPQQWHMGIWSHRGLTENTMLNHGFSDGPHMISHDLDTVYKHITHRDMCIYIYAYIIIIIIILVVHMHCINDACIL